MPHRAPDPLIARYLLATAVVGRLRPALAPIAGERWSADDEGTIHVALNDDEPAATMRIQDGSPGGPQRAEYIAQLSPATVGTLLTLVEDTLDEHCGLREWTSVERALPSTSASVLAWHRDDGHKVLRYLSPSHAGGGTCGWHTLDRQPVEAAQVLAWRILPPPFSPAQGMAASQAIGGEH